MPGDAAELTAVDLRRATEALLVAHAKNGNGSWLARHQAWTIALATALVALVTWAVNTWTRQQVHEIQAPIDAKQDAAIVEETKERKAVTDVLQQNDEDFADYAEEADRYERRVLDGVANKLEVDLPPRAELDRATNQLRGIKDRRRKQ